MLSSRSYLHARVCLHGLAARSSSSKASHAGRCCRGRYYHSAPSHESRHGEVRPLHAVRNDGPPLWYSTPESKTDLRSLYPDEGTAKHDESDGLIHVDYNCIIGDDGETLQEGLFRLLHSVFRDGAAIVSTTPFSYQHRSEGSTSNNNNYNNTIKDAPQLIRALETMSEDDLPVSKVAKAMSGGSLSHGSLYGKTFHVRVGERDGNNIAYTSAPLAPHMDLAYYESPPGMQLLHCVSMGRAVVGGESTLIDGMAAAHRLRELRPESFETLARCPATFVKQRDGAGMTYRRPHVGLSKEGVGSSETTTTTTTATGDREIHTVYWSPPFEGPVCLPPEKVDRYYEAYADYECLLNGGDTGGVDGDLCRYAREYTWERKLRPGDMLVFNNQRMLHGRRGFSTPEGASFEDAQRHLVGCYTNMDDTLNSYRVLLREKGAASTSILNVGNGTNIVP